MKAPPLAKQKKIPMRNERTSFLQTSFQQQTQTNFQQQTLTRLEEATVLGYNPFAKTFLNEVTVIAEEKDDQTDSSQRSFPSSDGSKSSSNGFF